MAETMQAEAVSGALPPKVAAAVAAVMADVPKLAKSEKNLHGNYVFASIDGFLEAVRPLCAKHGLIILQNEESFDFHDGTGKDGKPRSWLVMKFGFTLAHSSGETWTQPQARTIMVDASMGSQAFGAAQSYSLKQYMRSLFQIATGEAGQDADEHPPADLPPRGKTSRDLDWRGPLTKTKLQDELRRFDRALRETVHIPDELDNLLDEYRVVLEQCQADIPGWWNGMGQSTDFVPLKERIDAKRKFLAGDGSSEPYNPMAAG